MTKLNIQDIYGTDELEVLIGETQTIIPMQERMGPRGFVFKLANGEIVVGAARSDPYYPRDRYSLPMPPGQTSRALSWRRSKDSGKTWHETPAWSSYFTHQFPDGEIIQLPCYWCRLALNHDRVYSLTLFRSIDNGLTFKKEKIILADIPELACIPTKYTHRKKERYAQVNDRIVRLHDGSLLASMMGKFKNDIKERTFIVRSIDRGKIWNYLSTVAFDLTKKGIRPNGFNEPDLLVLPDGDILCFMRSNGRHREPLFMSRSRDDGKTWSHADPVADRGVYPTACLMANGIIAVVYGRPGDWLMFSLDKGETWISHFCFNQSPEPYDCGNYNWVEEIAPDILLIIYSQTDPNDCMISKIMGTYFTVRPR